MVLLSGKGNPNSGIAGSRFDNCRYTFSYLTTINRILNHVLAQAVFDAASWIKHFQFGVNVTVIWNIDLQINQWRMTDQFWNGMNKHK